MISPNNDAAIHFMVTSGHCPGVDRAPEAEYPKRRSAIPSLHVGMFVMLLITLVAVAAAVAAWLRPIPHSTSATPAAPTYSEQQVADAKAKVCGAFEKVHQVLQMNSTRSGGDDPNSQLLVAVNARQIFMTGSAYLLTTLSDYPATTSDLAAAISGLAHLYQTITLDGLASDLSVSSQNAANAKASEIEGLCK
jgi:hypothetical protein